MKQQEAALKAELEQKVLQLQQQKAAKKREEQLRELPITRESNRDTSFHYK